MPTVRLTDAAVQRLKAPPGQRVDFFDGAFPGLALRVTGAVDQRPERRAWTLFYRFGGKQRRLTFEDGYPALDLKKARQKATEAQLLIRAGKDPAVVQTAAKAAGARAPDTVASVCRLYVAHLERRQKSAAYIRETRRNLGNHVLPRWGERDIKGISRRDVVELLDAIADAGSTIKRDGKQHHLAGGPVMANRTLAAIRGMLNYAADELEISVTPLRRVRGPGIETPRDRVLGADEITALWPRLARLEYPYGPAFQLMLVLGQRRSEVTSMKWTDVDLTEGVWTLAASSTKAGRLSVVPLPKFAIEILTRVPKLGQFVFRSSIDKPIAGFSSALARLASIPGGPTEPWTVHDLRRTAATEMGRLGAPEFIISKVLNHASHGVTGKVYNRYEYISEKRHALEMWASYLGNLTQPPSANVVRMRQVAHA
jgi:integrase